MGGRREIDVSDPKQVRIGKIEPDGSVTDLPNPPKPA